MTELEDIKNYARIDADIADDDALLESLIEAAKRYIETNTGKEYQEDDPVMLLCLRILVVHWYTNRSAVSKGSIQKYPHSLSDILKHIELSDEYPAKEATSS
ncbi:head-tail connector protein [Megasphaera elsdenii]|jgi:uncharacterized phage protein (predicted DNA packaging)|uniref:head-tail connector protein n=1 Tax=Megasphaera elsdenii TaxID=907 RepID=UPI0035220C11